MTDKSAYRIATCSSFGPTLESESLPIVGQDRERDRFRARFWRAMFVSLALIWGAFAWLIVAGS